MLTPSADKPKGPTVDLESVFAQLFWLGLDHKGRDCEGGTRTGTNKIAAPFATAVQAKLVAGA